MRDIHVEAGLRLRFPGQGEDFDDGVEVGIAAGLMAAAETTFVQSISDRNLEQLRDLAAAMRYRLIVLAQNEGYAQVQFCQTRLRPKLSLVSGMPSEPVPDKQRA